MINLKINLTINQLIATDFFLGYSTSNWNSLNSYFLLGKFKFTNIFNVNYTFFLYKRVITLISGMLLTKSSVWLVNENFDLFYKNSFLSSLPNSFDNVFFFNKKWCKGSLSNYKFVKFFKPSKFPHVICAPNLINNHFVVNEARLVGIPSVSLIDSVDNPLNTPYLISGNSKSIKSTIFFYLMISKTVLNSRCLNSSSFLFTFFRKAKKIFKNSYTHPFYFSKGFFNNYLQFTVLDHNSFLNKIAILNLIPIRQVRKTFFLSKKKRFYFWKHSLLISIYSYINKLYKLILNLAGKNLVNINSKKPFLKTLLNMVV